VHRQRCSSFYSFKQIQEKVTAATLSVIEEEGSPRTNPLGLNKLNPLSQLSEAPEFQAETLALIRRMDQNGALHLTAAPSTTEQSLPSELSPGSCVVTRLRSVYLVPTQKASSEPVQSADAVRARFSLSTSGLLLSLNPPARYR
jgi:hypothetical protein